MKTTATSNKTTSTISLKNELLGLSKDQKDEVLSEIGELLVVKVLESVADSRSPIDGKKFEPLKKPDKDGKGGEYRAFKLKETGSDNPNLDLTGDMLTSLDFKIVNDKIELGVYGEDAGKADGHNNFSGKSKLPKRQFLPDKGEAFEDSIMSLISDTIDQYKADNATLSSKELKTIETKEDLYKYLAEVLGDYERSKLKSMVLSSELSVSLDDFDLLDLL